MKPKKKKKTREGKVTVNYNNLPGKEKPHRKNKKQKTNSKGNCKLLTLDAWDQFLVISRGRALK